MKKKSTNRIKRSVKVADCCVHAFKDVVQYFMESFPVVCCKLSEGIHQDAGLWQRRVLIKEKHPLECKCERVHLSSELCLVFCATETQKGWNQVLLTIRAPKDHTLEPRVCKEEREPLLLFLTDVRQDNVWIVHGHDSHISKPLNHSVHCFSLVHQNAMIRQVRVLQQRECSIECSKVRFADETHQRLCIFMRVHHHCAQVFTKKAQVLLRSGTHDKVAHPHGHPC